MEIAEGPGRGGGAETKTPVKVMFYDNGGANPSLARPRFDPHPTALRKRNWGVCWKWVGVVGGGHGARLLFLTPAH